VAFFSFTSYKIIPFDAVSAVISVMDSVFVAVTDVITGRLSAVVVVATVDMVVVESSVFVKIIAVGITMADKNKIAVTQEKIMHINFLVGIDKQL